ncbi:MAG TPA: PEGA domain-containing protein [Polyangiaceae bacterium]|nr:PEGA domain-containing protein [Polyangiaceae bacterium]
MLASSCCWLRSAAAQSLVDPLAESLKIQGDTALGEGRFEAALEAYQRAFAIEKSATLHYNRGRALQGLGRNAEALDALEAFEAEAPPELRAKVPRLAELLATVRASVAVLRLECAVSGATVKLDSRILGVTPLARPVRVDVGNHLLTVEADGYVPFSRRLSSSAGTLDEVRVKLLRPSDSARLRVRSGVAGARVFLDGEAVGQVPAELGVRAGRRLVRVEHPDYLTTSVPVTLAAGEARTVDVALESRPGLLQKWWFWAGIGAVAAGATLSVVALTTERAPSSGSIPPGMVSAPLVRFP